MNPIPDKIADFVNHQTCTTLCTVDDENAPYCFTCYYSFDEKKGLIHFKSNKESLHITYLAKQPKISGTILPDSLNKLVVKGIQLYGEVLDEKSTESTYGSINYYKKNPLAMAIKGQIFTIKLTKIKFTDTTLKIGGVTLWERNS
jgi:uncharacterized protein